MGASGWIERVRWCEDLANALATARARAYERVPIAERERAAAASVAEIVTAMDLDLDDDDTVNAFSTWATNARPESRYAALRGADGAHSVLDIDQVVTTAPAMTAPSLSPATSGCSPPASRPSSRPASPLAASGSLKVDRRLSA